MGGYLGVTSTARNLQAGVTRYTGTSMFEVAAQIGKGALRAECGPIMGVGDPAKSMGYRSNPHPSGLGYRAPQ